MMRRSADWRGKVALVTGASSGIGAATAKRLAAEGLCLILVARREDRLRSLAQSIQKAGGKALPVAADLTDEAGCERVVETAIAAYGLPDALINNAGIGWYGYGAEMPWEIARQMIQVNAAAVVQLTLLVLDAMRWRGSGHIINIGSVAGSLPSQGVALYSATKSFLDAFTAGLHRELRGSGVHTSVVRPGPVVSEFYGKAAGRRAGHPVPAGRFAVPASVVSEAVWSLLRRPRRVLYVPPLLSLAPWIELLFGGLIDRLGPLLLRHTAARLCVPADKPRPLPGHQRGAGGET